MVSLGKYERVKKSEVACLGCGGTWWIEVEDGAFLDCGYCGARGFELKKQLPACQPRLPSQSPITPITEAPAYFVMPDVTWDNSTSASGVAVTSGAYAYAAANDTVSLVNGVCDTTVYERGSQPYA